MRWIVIGALAIAALAAALLFAITSHTEPTPASTTRASTRTPAPSVTPAPVAIATAPVEAHARAIRASRVTPAPTLASAVPTLVTSSDKPKHVDTPTDILRWSLMRAIRNSEPAVIDCLDQARAAGTTIDGTAIFAFYVTTKDAKAVISRPAVETSSFPDAVSTCILNTVATGELDQELPEGQPEFRVLRQLTVEKGAITRYKLKSFLPPP